MLALQLLAAASDGGELTIEGVLLQLGLPGIVIMALAWYAKRTITEAEARAKRFEDDNRRLYTLIAEQMMPALTKSTSSVDRATALLSDIDERERIDALAEEKAAAKKRRSTSE